VDLSVGGVGGVDWWWARVDRFVEGSAGNDEILGVRHDKVEVVAVEAAAAGGGNGHSIGNEGGRIGFANDGGKGGVRVGYHGCSAAAIGMVQRSGRQWRRWYAVNFSSTEAQWRTTVWLAVGGSVCLALLMQSS
jgi:hypothetical protein